MRVERLVLDTNVVISAVLSPLGKPYACLRWALDNATLMVSRELLEGGGERGCKKGCGAPIWISAFE